MVEGAGVRCVKCHRPLKNPPGPHGMGPTCEKSAKPIEAHDRDLFGFNVELASKAAAERIRVQIEVATVDALLALRHEAAAARRRLGVWSAQ